MREVRLGLLGCGLMGSDLMRNAVQLRGVKAAGLYDPIRASRECLAQEIGGTPVTSEVAACENCDAVIVAPPNDLHARLALLAIHAGRQVFLEKPMALSVKDCNTLIREAKRVQAILMVGHVLRYVPIFATVKSLVEAGHVGELLSIRLARSFFTFEEWARPWRMKKRRCGGILFESQIHELDFMRYLAGDVRRVSAVANRSGLGEWDFPDSIFVNLEFRSGAIGNLFAGLVDRIGFQGGEVLGTKGALHFTCPNTIVLQSGKAKRKEIDVSKKKLEPCVRREMREFIEAVRGEGPVTLPAEVGRDAIALVEAAYSSAVSGKSVEISRIR
ncbi:MAG TPA: Gfo/Idh/MocA family oxidoreductase [bacterium]|nr:Gfo/Idh/MocA family oxidoreductase [bacterium]